MGKRVSRVDQVYVPWEPTGERQENNLRNNRGLGALQTSNAMQESRPVTRGIP